MFPMQADVFYPLIQQGEFGAVSKQWMLDKIIVGNFTPAGAAMKEEVVPNIAITKDILLVCRIKTDIRISTREANNAITNILVTNIRNSAGINLYIETAGPRVDKATLFEVATQEPHIGPFGDIEYYNMVLRRSENQGVDL
jgi:hypothetical protein